MPRFSATNRFRLFFALEFTGVAIFGPYLALYLGSIGLSGSQIGLILGTLPLAGFLVQPLWGLASDIYHWRRDALVVACFGVAVSAAWFGLASDFRLLYLLALLIAVMRGPITPLGNALALEHLERNENEPGFGSLRLWGSIGFALAVFGIGSLLVEGAVGRIVPLYSLTMLLLGLTALTLPDAEIHDRTNWRDGVTLLTRDRKLAAFLLAALLAGATLGVVNNYLAVYLADIHAPGWMIGLALAVAALFEVPLMARAPAFIRRWGLRLVLVGGMAVLPVRWALYAFIDEPLLVLPAQVLHSIAMMSLLVVGVLYVDQQLSRSWRATGQALYSAALHGVGPSLGLLAAGVIYEHAGIRPVWLASAVVALAGLVVLQAATRVAALPEVRPEVSP